MSLEEQITLVDYMIKKDPDLTIMDFIVMKREFEVIEWTTKMIKEKAPALTEAIN